MRVAWEIPIVHPLNVASGQSGEGSKGYRAGPVNYPFLEVWLRKHMDVIVTSMEILVKSDSR